jgi:HrpA-like RNA helicase
MQYDSKKRLSTLSETFISRASASQRAGRAGSMNISLNILIQ